jgi:hypothetical protein
VRVECYAATRTQEGKSANEDAFLIGRGERPFAALCDGAGNAQQAAKKVLGLFEKLFKEASPQQVAVYPTWANWIKLLDSSLLGGPQSTFLGVAIVDRVALGACVGDLCGHRWLATDHRPPEKCAKCRRRGWNRTKPTTEKPAPAVERAPERSYESNPFSAIRPAKVTTCAHGVAVAKGYHCWQCGGLAKVEHDA